MIALNSLTLVGNLTYAPELRFTPSGNAVANFTIAHTPRRYDTTAKAFVDGDTMFLEAVAWNTLAENIAESFDKGTRVIVTGSLKQEFWDDVKTGEKRSKIKLTVDSIGADLQFAQVKVAKTARRSAPEPEPVEEEKPKPSRSRR